MMKSKSVRLKRFIVKLVSTRKVKSYGKLKEYNNDESFSSASVPPKLVRVSDDEQSSSSSTLSEKNFSPSVNNKLRSNNGSQILLIPPYASETRVSFSVNDEVGPVYEFEEASPPSTESISEKKSSSATDDDFEPIEEFDQSLLSPTDTEKKISFSTDDELGPVDEIKQSLSLATSVDNEYRPIDEFGPGTRRSRSGKIYKVYQYDGDDEEEDKAKEDQIFKKTRRNTLVGSEKVLLVHDEKNLNEMEFRREEEKIELQRFIYENRTLADKISFFLCSFDNITETFLENFLCHTDELLCTCQVTDMINNCFTTPVINDFDDDDIILDYGCIGCSNDYDNTVDEHTYDRNFYLSQPPSNDDEEKCNDMV